MDDDDTIIELQHELSTRQLSREIGDQLIIEGDDEERMHGFLAGIAFDTLNNDEYDMPRTLMEFLRNERRFSRLRDDELDQIEELLNDGYVGDE